LTASGSRLVAACSLFCACTWATSMSAPGSKVRVLRERPAASLVELMYSRLSMPFNSCSISWVTELLTVSAEAPV
jgi:hypothetical protein